MRPELASSKWLRSAFGLHRHVGKSSSELPLFLCPAFRGGPSPFNSAVNTPNAATNVLIRRLHAQPEAPSISTTAPPLATLSLPRQCFGCGALTQTSRPDIPGYYNLSRKAVALHLGHIKPESNIVPEKRRREEDGLVEAALRSLNLAEMEQMGVDLKRLIPSAPTRPTPDPAVEAKPPLCERCHQLLHHHTGTPIFHPSVESLRETMQESPHKYNHVYHVLDAADFPMSLLPKINELLDLGPLRSRNRRARQGYFSEGRKNDLSFVITRSDLLAPKKEQVDALMPYLREVLRKALGRSGRHVRLGNVRCVSSKRNWWTGELKKEIWERGGGRWLVGKVNVGKSQLFRVVFPQGKIASPPKQDADPFQGLMNLGSTKVVMAESSFSDSRTTHSELEDEVDGFDQLSLLPPAQPETKYPPMPLIHHLPGTTASPIRVPFGNGKGELIDLPGITRGDLELFVKDEERASLVMRSRVIPIQQTLRPGQSLLLGGFIRITPQTPGLVFLTYAFTPIVAHVTATDKAIAIQEQKEDAPIVENIALPGTGDKIKHAGSFKLAYDVTKRRAGPLTRRDAVGLNVDRLPFRVLSIDLLIEGCGWVEIVAQVRTRQLFSKPAPRPQLAPQNPDRLESLEFSDFFDEDPVPPAEEKADEPNWPVVDVYSPEGRLIGSRPPMNGWLLNKPLIQDTKSRPRKSMKGAKKNEKRARRQAAAAASV